MPKIAQGQKVVMKSGDIIIATYTSLNNQYCYGRKLNGEFYIIRFNEVDWKSTAEQNHPKLPFVE